MSDRSEMEQVIHDCPDHLYTYAPEPRDRRYVFTDKTCLGLPEAYRHAIALKVRAEVGHD